MGTSPPPASRTAAAVERSIDALLARRRRERHARSLSERVSERVTTFAGSMTFAVLHAIGFGLWILISCGRTPLPR